MSDVDRLSFLAPFDDVAKFRQGANARGLTQGEYLSRLLRLYEMVRVRAEESLNEGDGPFTDWLKDLGLEAVTV